MKRTGVLVPTLFRRSDFLRQCLESIRKSGTVHIILMGPQVVRNSANYTGLFDQLVEEPKVGNLAEKLNSAFASVPKELEILTWVGDDDLLEPSSIEYLEPFFSSDPSLTLIYGACDYIDSKGNRIGQNKSGPWALALAKIGPFLAPQPGSLFTRKAFEAIDGLDTKFTLAFDFDLFLRLSGFGKTKYVGRKLASFRWHEESLSVSQRRASVREASLVRLKHAKPWLGPLLRVTNPAVEQVTFLAGLWVALKLKRWAR